MPLSLIFPLKFLFSGSRNKDCHDGEKVSGEREKKKAVCGSRAKKRRETFIATDGEGRESEVERV